MADEDGSSRRGGWRWLIRWPGGLALVALCVCCYLPGLRSIPPVDRDESRFAQASRRMLRSGTVSGWVVPRLGDRPRLNKPPLIYWLQAGSAAVFGAEEPARDAGASRPRLETGRIWVYRVPSVLCATLATLCVWGIGRSMFPRDRVAPWLAGAMLATAVVVLWDARQARADQLLLVLTTAAMGALWRLWREHLLSASPEASSKTPQPRRRWMIALWMLIALGVLAKGPITLMVVGLTAVSLAAMTGRWRWLLALRPGMGAAIVALLVGPWVALVMREVGVREYWTVLVDETFGRSVAASEGHWGPPGYHLLLLPVMFWPGSLFTAAGVAAAWRSARGGMEGRWWRRWKAGAPAEMFLLAWLIPAWIVFEAVTTKLPHYTLPLYPAVALLSARAMSEASGRARGLGLGGVVWLVIGAVIASGVAAGLARVFGFAAPPGWMTAMGAGVGVGAGLIVASARALYTRAFVLAQTLGILAAVVASAVLFGVVLPRLSALWVSSRLMTVIDRADPARAARVASAGYGEDSLEYLLDGRMERVRVSEAGEWSSRHAGALIVLPTDRAQEALGSDVKILGRAAGFNYSKGEWVDLVVARAFQPVP